MAKKLTVLSGAGMSSESGISTFRDKGGLWEGHDVMEVASPQGWSSNPELVLKFYNDRRRQLLEVTPNEGHIALKHLEDQYNVSIVTQNVDDLHERAGSSHVLHLHGELLKARSVENDSLVYDWHKDIRLGDTAEDGAQLRPHIVWFGEMVPKLEEAVQIVSRSDIVVIIGTSLQVYPAASLISYAPSNAKVFYVDPNPFISYELKLRPHQLIREKAVSGCRTLSKYLLEK